MEILSESEAQTIAAALALARTLQSRDIVLLHGDLGTGKSVFARALIRHLTGNPQEEVPSPTFTLVQTYDTALGPLFHFDLYRLRDAEEIYHAGWEDALAEGLVVAEWAERLGAAAPQRAINIYFESVGDQPNRRRIRIEQGAP